MEKDPNDTNGRALLVADTDETQAYVFESNKLPEIRGASRQLDKLNRDAGDLIGGEEYKGTVLYAAGGSILALVDSDKAPDLVTKIENSYREQTSVATISAAFRLLPADYKEHRFGEYVRWAGHWLRRHKESKEAPPFYETLPYQTVCLSCHKRPANADYLDKMPDWPICTVCYDKRQAGLRRAQDEQTKTWHDRFETWLDGPGSNQKDDYYRGYDPDIVDVPQTISEIGDTQLGRAGYVGFIYLDGDGIGELLTRMQDEADYARLSEQLSQITEEAVYAALLSLRVAVVEGNELRRETGRADQVGQKIPIHPFEIITIGGDDVLLIVPAYTAIPVAQRIGATFGERMTPLVRQLVGKDEPPVTMSAGVVIAEEHTPVQMLYQLAHQLLKEAKKVRGALDFHVLKSADMVDRAISTIREQYPYYLENQGDKPKDVRLLARPYRHEQIDKLWKQLCQLKQDKFPTSQMHLLARSLLQGRREATLFYHYQYQRQRNDRKAYLALDNVLTDLQGTEIRDPLPWQTVKNEAYSHQTMLWDIAELYDFAPQGEIDG